MVAAGVIVLPALRNELGVFYNVDYKPSRGFTAILTAESEDRWYSEYCPYTVHVTPSYRIHRA